MKLDETCFLSNPFKTIEEVAIFYQELRFVRSVLSTMDLTAEQKKFMDAIEDEFHDRFTESDAVYWEEHTTPLSDPPIIEPWYNKPRRRFDFSRRGRGGGDFNGRNRGRDYPNHSRNDSRRDRDRSRDRDRDRDHDRDRRRDSRGDQGRHGNRSGYGDHHGRDDGRNRDHRRQRPSEDHSRSHDRDQW